MRSSFICLDGSIRSPPRSLRSVSLDSIQDDNRGQASKVDQAAVKKDTDGLLSLAHTSLCTSPVPLAKDSLAQLKLSDVENGQQNQSLALCNTEQSDSCQALQPTRDNVTNFKAVSRENSSKSSDTMHEHLKSRRENFTPAALSSKATISTKPASSHSRSSKTRLAGQVSSSPKTPTQKSKSAPGSSIPVSTRSSRAESLPSSCNSYARPTSSSNSRIKGTPSRTYSPLSSKKGRSMIKTPMSTPPSSSHANPPVHEGDRGAEAKTIPGLEYSTTGAAL